jgi:hypothetical protein
LTVVGGAVTKARCVGTPGVTVTNALFAAVRVLDESVAVNVHAPAVLMMRSGKVATPPTAYSAVTPESLQTDVSVMRSLSPVVELTVAPLLASTATVYVDAVPAVTVPVGCVLKPTCVGVFELMAMAAVVAVASDPLVLSVAVNTHAVPAVRITLLKVATPLAVVADSVPVRVHPPVAVEMAMESEETAVSTLPVGPTTETWNDGSGTE